MTKRRQNNIDLKQLIYPLFVVSGESKKQKVPSMPGVFRFSVDTLVKEVRHLRELGIKKYLLFGVPNSKDWQGTGAYRQGNIVEEAVGALKSSFKDIVIMTDVCLCAYLTHGHCGIIKKGAKIINRSQTLKALSSMALTHARAGADYVAPSAMAKGQVAAIRKQLDKEGYFDVKIMGYSAKFASNFYGPFRKIASSAPLFGDRSKYQLDSKRTDVALQKIKEDIGAGADIVMVKPALSYLDVIRKAKDSFKKTLAVYNVSGEYSLIKTGARQGFFKEKDIVYEILHSFKRAGADLIITYHAKDIATWQK
ncbi:MAG: porphobilinogen synthase [Candidatus Zapsychrus exili]|nr:porphobilinogen synthase [Candidatus Zapsychrus exili]